MRASRRRGGRRSLCPLSLDHAQLPHPYRCTNLFNIWAGMCPVILKNCAALLFFVPSTAAVTGECLFSTPAGDFDLSSLGDVPFFTPANGWVYYVNACANVGLNASWALVTCAGGYSGAPTAPALQLTGTACFSLGSLSQRAASPLDGDLGIAVKLEGGSECQSTRRAITLEVVCSDTARPAGHSIVESEPCKYSARLEARAGCPLQCARDPLSDAVCGSVARGACRTSLQGARAYCVCEAGFSGPHCAPHAAAVAASQPPPLWAAIIAAVAASFVATAARAFSMRGGERSRAAACCARAAALALAALALCALGVNWLSPPVTFPLQAAHATAAPPGAGRAPSARSDNGGAGAALAPTSALAPLRVARFGIYLSPCVAFATVCAALEEVSGRSLIDVGEDLGSADIIFGGPFKPPAVVTAALAHHRDHAMLIFGDYENMQAAALGPVGPAPHDELVRVVDAAFSHAKGCKALDAAMPEGAKVAISGACFAHASGKHLWSPWWLQFAVDPVTREFFPALTHPTDASSWLARPRFASFFAAKEDYFPRRLMFDTLGGLARELDAVEPRNRMVHAPGLAFHNTELEQSAADRKGEGTAVGKERFEFSQTCRFSMTPENSRSWTEGYTTEKIGVAHRAGQVPVYWGDPPDERVWNRKRVIILGDAAGKVLPRAPNVSTIVDTIRRLELDADFRKAWFAEPILAISAAEWLRAWFDDARLVLRAGFSAYAERKRKAVQ